MKVRKILVAVKPWERGLPLAANHARQLAERVGAELELVATVFDAGVAARSERGEAKAGAAQARALAAARVELERLAGSMRDWGARVTTKAIWGVPAYEAILASARDGRADLVVVGAHEAQSLHTRLTDTDWQLMRRARCPLLLVKSASFNGYANVLAAIDPLHAHDEPAGLDRAVLAAARWVGQACGSKLRAVYAYPGAAAFDLASAVEVAPGVFYGAENVEAVHRRAAEELSEQYGIAADAIDLVVGKPAEAIVDVAARRRAELVVIGTQQRRGMLAAAVVASVACDVLIVPPVTEAP